jgi:hypothetical protein
MRAVSSSAEVDGHSLAVELKKAKQSILIVAKSE